MGPAFRSRVRRLLGARGAGPWWGPFHEEHVLGELGAVLAEDPARHVHVAQCVRDVEAGLRRRNLWTLFTPRGEPAGLLQAVRGISWALTGLLPRREALDLVATRVRSRGLRHAVLLGEDWEVEHVLRRFEGDARVQVERRPQWRMSRVPGEGPGRTGVPEGWRRAAVEDVPWLLEAHGAMCREDLGRDLVARDREAYERYFRELARLGRVFLVERGGRPVHKLEVPLVAGGAWLIEGVYTVPSARRRGIAREAVAHVTSLIERAGGIACLHVNRGNEGAIDLYRGLGYEVRGTWLVAIVRRA